MVSKRDEKLEEGLADQLESLDLEVEEGQLEPRCIGVAFAMFSPEIEVDTAEDDRLTADRASLEEEIRSHLEGWESLSPKEFADRWREYATDPYVGVGPHWVGLVDEDTVEEWLESEDLKEALRTHPPFSPRRVSLTGLELTHLAPSRILAAYRVEESYENGETTVGNTFAVLFRTGDGWKIGVASKGTRHEAAIRQ